MLQHLKKVMPTTKLTLRKITNIIKNKLKLIGCCNTLGEKGNPNIKTYFLRHMNHLLQHSKIIRCDIPKVSYNTKKQQAQHYKSVTATSLAMRTWMCNKAWAKAATLAPDVSLGLSCPTH